MKRILTALTILLASMAGAHAQGFNIQALQQQLTASPAMQQAQGAVMQQALQQMAANPQMLQQMAGSLSPQQQSSLMQQAMVAGQQIFTPAEQAKLAAFTSTPEGASIAAKLPQLVQQLAPVVLQMVATQQGAATAPAAGK